MDLPVRDSGLGLLIVGKCHQGDRPYMEDYIYATAYKEDCFMAVYDGHGGYEAAQYAYDNLWETIKTQNGFYHYQPKIVSNAIINGFMATHESMWKRRETWKKTTHGDLSTSGTTATCALLRKNQLYIANVGDSTAVIGKVNPRFGLPRQPNVQAKIITDDHKPDDKKERHRIEALGGSVSKSMRVVWERKILHDGVILIEKIPLLNIARSLGDLWSATDNNQYLISPVPDVHVYNIDSQDLFIILASDGLWNMLNPQKVVEKVHRAAGLNNITAVNEAAHSLISEALYKWKKHGRKADNISVIICVFANRKGNHFEQSSREKATSLACQSTSKNAYIVPDHSLYHQCSEEQLFFD